MKRHHGNDQYLAPVGIDEAVENYCTNPCEMDFDYPQLLTCSQDRCGEVVETEISHVAWSVGEDGLRTPIWVPTPTCTSSPSRLARGCEDC